MPKWQAGRIEDAERDKMTREDSLARSENAQRSASDCTKTAAVAESWKTASAGCHGNGQFWDYRLEHFVGRYIKCAWQHIDFPTSVVNTGTALY